MSLFKKRGYGYSSRREGLKGKIFNLKTAFMVAAAAQLIGGMVVGYHAAGGGDASAADAVSTMSGVVLSSVFGGAAGGVAGLAVGFGITKLSGAEGHAESAVGTILGGAGLCIGYAAGAIGGPMMYLS